MTGKSLYRNFTMYMKKEEDISKYTTQQIELAAMARALGHPARIAILEELCKREECVCGDLVDALPLSQSTVSQHLSVLKSAGFIVGNISGTFTCYCMNKEKGMNLMEKVKNLFLKNKKCC